MNNDNYTKEVIYKLYFSLFSLFYIDINIYMLIYIYFHLY